MTPICGPTTACRDICPAGRIDNAFLLDTSAIPYEARYRIISDCIVVLASTISLAALKPSRTRSCQLLAVLRMPNRVSRSSLCVSFLIKAAASLSADGLSPSSALVGSTWFFLLPACCRGLADRLILVGVFPSGLLGLPGDAMGLLEGVEGPWKDASRLIFSGCSTSPDPKNGLRMQCDGLVKPGLRDSVVPITLG